jgi:hypothetical protein
LRPPPRKLSGSPRSFRLLKVSLASPAPMPPQLLGIERDSLFAKDRADFKTQDRSFCNWFARFFEVKAAISRENEQEVRL